MLQGLTIALWLLLEASVTANGDGQATMLSTAIVPALAPSSHFDRRAPGDWKFEDQFEFYGFWLPNEEKVVKNSLLGAIDLLETTLKVLGGAMLEGLPTGEADPSFERYFRAGDLNVIGGVFQRILAVLGAPGTEGFRRCIEATKLQLIYGDGPNSNYNCQDPIRGVFAYYNSYQDANGIVRSYVSFCKLFFDRYKTHLPGIPGLEGVPYVDASKFGTAIDTADPRQLPEAESGASIVVHELFHWSDVTKPVVAVQIEDISLTRPDNRGRVTAYRSFYAMKVKDTAYKATRPPTENADNYVYMILEIFYRYKYGRQPWQDSLDLHGIPASPVVPPTSP